VEGVSFSVALTAEQEQSLARAVRDSPAAIVPVLCRIDGIKAQAQEASDLQMIQGAIAQAGGMDKLNGSVMRMLRTWLLDVLRKAQAQWAPEDAWEKNQDMILFQSNAAIFLAELGQHYDSLVLQKRVWSALKITAGVDHPITINIMHNLACRFGITRIQTMKLRDRKFTRDGNTKSKQVKESKRASERAKKGKVEVFPFSFFPIFPIFPFFHFSLPPPPFFFFFFPFPLFFVADPVVGIAGIHLFELRFAWKATPNSASPPRRLSSTSKCWTFVEQSSAKTTPTC
jgi:hypothetical protein